jgi:hypothetical protein
MKSTNKRTRIDSRRDEQSEANQTFGSVAAVSDEAELLKRIC